MTKVVMVRNLVDENNRRGFFTKNLRDSVPPYGRTSTGKPVPQLLERLIRSAELLVRDAQTRILYVVTAYRITLFHRHNRRYNDHTSTTPQILFPLPSTYQHILKSTGLESFFCRSSVL